ncbi:helix-turn-helix transcriptional regulator [Sphingomonas sp.]|uniref:helix-turn-helix transcriptional regulator n=1 Tax=Sphingomonas sp. TaxID=28214 RepID=UPI0025811167|nr:helix-turn-helix transcriptional regulator [Sphingomonas sp.]
MEDAPNRIRELRTAQGLSQQAVGDMIGVSKMTVSDLERGRMELTVEYMRRLARALGAKPSDLLQTADNPDRLSDEERELLYRFRAAAPSQRELIKRIAEPVDNVSDDRRVA